MLNAERAPGEESLRRLESCRRRTAISYNMRTSTRVDGESTIE